MTDEEIFLKLKEEQKYLSSEKKELTIEDKREVIYEFLGKVIAWFFIISFVVGMLFVLLSVLFE